MSESLVAPGAAAGGGGAGGGDKSNSGSSSSSKHIKISRTSVARGMDGWSSLPSNALVRILLRLDRDDVARSSAVCRHWNRIVDSESFQRNYRKHRNVLTWVWFAACIDDASSTSSSSRIVALNVGSRKCFRLLEVPSCPTSRYHPKLCWFDFASTEGLIAWACRHTQGSIRVGNPLKPSSIRAVPDLPAFPDSMQYEFRLGIAVDARSRNDEEDEDEPESRIQQQQQQQLGFKIVVMRLGWPHSEAATSSATLLASVYRSATREWEISQVKVNNDLKRWGSSVVCRGHFYVLLRPPSKHGPLVGLLSYNLSGQEWRHFEVALPAHVRYNWQDRMDLIDRRGVLTLVVFGLDSSKGLTIYQLEQPLEHTRTRAGSSRWLSVGSMPISTHQHFCEELGSQWHYRCRGCDDYIFFTGQPNGPTYLYWVPRGSWHRLDMSLFSEMDPSLKSSRYFFNLTV